MKLSPLFLSVFLSASLFGQNVNIPDANFKAYLVGNSAINTNSDTEIQLGEASAFAGTIDCNGQNIYDLTGIEAFTALTYLYCYNNYLTSLNVFSNSALETLFCYGNQLPSLDISSNTALISLNCQGNQIGSLDLSNSTALEAIYCGLNQLTSLDLSSNTSLTFLDCFGNQLTSLDVSNNTSLGLMGCGSNQLASLDVSNNTVLTVLFCDNNQLECLNFKNGNNTYLISLLASGNPNLTCIEVDDVNYSTANWTDIDAQTSYSTDCNNNGCLPCISTSSTDIQIGCESYTWIDGNLYTFSNNSATFLTTNSAGCDSLITLDLTINTPSIGVDVQEICTGDEYTWIDGNIYTEINNSATYTMVGNAANGCDSLVTLNLSVISVPEPIIMQNGNTLSCTNFATAYQWLDCDANYAPIEGATDMVFTASQNGSYALEITFVECSDTSECYTIDFVGISELNSTPKQIVKIIDLMGRETSFKPNTPLIYVYDDGSIEKVFRVEY